MIYMSWLQDMAMGFCCWIQHQAANFHYSTPREKPEGPLSLSSPLTRSFTCGAVLLNYIIVDWT